MQISFDQLVQMLKTLSQKENFEMARVKAADEIDEQVKKLFQMTGLKLGELSEIQKNDFIEQNYHHFEKVHLSLEESLFVKNLIDHDVFGYGPISLFLSIKDFFLVRISGSQLFVNKDGDQDSFSFGFVSEPMALNSMERIATRFQARLDQKYPVGEFSWGNHLLSVALPPVSAQVWIQLAHDETSLVPKLVNTPLTEM